MRNRYIAGYHRFVSHASLPELVHFFGNGSREYRDYLLSICRGSKRKCKHTNQRCRICPVNWDCSTLKSERIKLGWKENE